MLCRIRHRWLLEINLLTTAELISIEVAVVEKLNFIKY